MRRAARRLQRLVSRLLVRLYSGLCSLNQPNKQILVRITENEMQSIGRCLTFDGNRVRNERRRASVGYFEGKPEPPVPPVFLECPRTGAGFELAMRLKVSPPIW